MSESTPFAKRSYRNIIQRIAKMEIRAIPIIIGLWYALMIIDDRFTHLRLAGIAIFGIIGCIIMPYILFQKTEEAFQYQPTRLNHGAALLPASITTALLTGHLHRYTHTAIAIAGIATALYIIHDGAKLRVERRNRRLTQTPPHSAE